MSALGSINGELLLRVGSQTINLGRLVIPLRAKNLPRTDSGADEVTVEISADVARIRDAIAARFASEGDTV